MDSYLHRPASLSSRYFYELSGWGRGLMSAEPPLGPGLCLTRPGHPPGGRGPGPSFQMREADAARGHVTHDLCSPPAPQHEVGSSAKLTGVSSAGISPARHDTLVLTRTRAHAPTDTHTQHRRTRVHTEAWASHIHTPHTPACRKGRARSQREKGEKSSGSFMGFQRLVQTQCF